MKRLIDHYLNRWKQDPERKALLVRGARQVGKTYSIRTLGASFEELVEINLELNPEYAEVFQLNLDPLRILKELRLMTGKHLVPGKSLLFIDEVQQHPPAVTALRYFYEKVPEMHVIAAGSLLEFALEEVGVPVGRVASLHMHPMSFLEFLAARGKEEMVGFLLDDGMLSCSGPVHGRLLRLAGEYLVLGGLPEVVQNWVEYEDLGRCNDILDIIASAYRQDFSKYAKRYQIKYVDLLFNEIPGLAGKKFKFNALPGAWKARELAPALDLLCKASIVHKVTHSSGNGIPLRAESDPRRFKTLFFDIGLSQRIMGANTRPWLLNPETNIVNAGSVVEAFVGQELLAYSRPGTKAELYYWHREARSSNAEVDYLLPTDHAVVPVEVKSGATGHLRSLRAFLDEKKERTPYGIRFCGLPPSMHENLHSYPLYAVPHVMRRQIPRDWF
ncbi:MAG: AAA family ATPase [Verrucomicrobiota bacterium]